MASASLPLLLALSTLLVAQGRSDVLGRWQVQAAGDTPVRTLVVTSADADIVIENNSGVGPPAGRYTLDSAASSGEVMRAQWAGDSTLRLTARAKDVSDANRAIDTVYELRLDRTGTLMITTMQSPPARPRSVDSHRFVRSSTGR